MHILISVSRGPIDDLHFLKVDEDTACHGIVTLVMIFGCRKDLADYWCMMFFAKLSFIETISIKILGIIKYNGRSQVTDIQQIQFDSQ